MRPYKLTPLPIHFLYKFTKALKLIPSITVKQLAMSKLTSFLFLLCLFSFICNCFSRPISHENDSDETYSGQTPVIEEDWWFHHHWPLVYPPMPGGSFNWPYKGWPYKKWPVDFPPKPPGWVFAKPPFPCPWWPKKGSVDVEIGDSMAAPPLAA